MKKRFCIQILFFTLHTAGAAIIMAVAENGVTSRSIVTVRSARQVYYENRYPGKYVVVLPDGGALGEANGNTVIVGGADKTGEETGSIKIIDWYLAEQYKLKIAFHDWTYLTPKEIEALAQQPGNELISATPSAWVQQIPGSRNYLTVTVIELYTDDRTTRFERTFPYLTTRRAHLKLAPTEFLWRPGATPKSALFI